MMTKASPAAQSEREVRSQLKAYRAKRDFTKTREPSGEKAAASPGFSYLVQKHAASRLHYDFRLELNGVLKSWAVTKGPSLNPEDKRLAVHVENHPLDYGSFEGTIPQGEYGGGTVMLWDQGTWEPAGNPARALARGNLTFIHHGKRLKGRWHLVRLRGNRLGDTKRENWLLIKGKDEYAEAIGEAAIENFRRASSADVEWRGLLAHQARAGARPGRGRRCRRSSAEKGTHSGTTKNPKSPNVPQGDAIPAFVFPHRSALVDGGS